jgi:ankyrin repeat protein
MWAAAEGHADVVKALLDAKADPNRKARVTTTRDTEARRSSNWRLHRADVRGPQRA